MKLKEDALDLALEHVEYLLMLLNGEALNPPRNLWRLERIVTLLAGLTRDYGKNLASYSELNGLLNLYRLIPRVAPSSEGWLAHHSVDYTSVSKEDAEEYEYVSALLTVLPRLDIGGRPLIRRCKSPNCQRWFLADRRDTLTCSNACRQWRYDNRSIEQKKAHRAQKMREYRRRLKERKERKARLGKK